MFSRCSVGVVPHVDVVCICGEEGDLHVLLLCHLESAPQFSLNELSIGKVLSSLS